MLKTTSVTIKKRQVNEIIFNVQYSKSKYMFLHLNSRGKMWSNNLNLRSDLHLVSRVIKYATDFKDIHISPYYDIVAILDIVLITFFRTLSTKFLAQF